MAFDTIETPAGRVEKVLGGSVNYFSLAAAHYAPIRVVGVVGKDFPQSHLEALKSRKIDISGVDVVEGKTFHWAGSYDTNLNDAKTLSTSLNVFEHFNPKLSNEQKKCKYVFLANIDPVLQQRVLDQMEKTDLVACDSMNFWIAGKLDELKKTLARVDILSINEGEAYLLSGTRNLATAAQVIRKMGPNVLVIKRGEYGASLFTANGVFLAPSFPVDRVIDPTGAGDSFAGAFMGFLTEAQVTRDWATTQPKKWEHLLKRAVLSGCVMASFTVEDFSINRLMTLNSKDLVDRQQQLLKMMSLD